VTGGHKFHWLRPVKERWPKLDVLLFARLQSRTGVVWLRQDGLRWGVENSFWVSDDATSLPDTLRSWLRTRRRFAAYGHPAHQLWQAGLVQDVFDAAGYACEFACLDAGYVYASFRCRRRGTRNPAVTFTNLTSLVPQPAIEAITSIFGWAHGRPGHEASEVDVLGWAELLGGTLSCVCQYLGVPSIAPTAGQFGYRLFRSRFLLPRDVAKLHEPQLLDYVHTAAASAPVILGRTGTIDGKWYYVDAHQMYHYCASVAPVAGYPVCSRYLPGLGEAKSMVRDGPCFAMVELDRSEYFYPRLSGPRQWAYNGQPGVTVLCGRELEFALQCGHVRDVHWISLWSPSISVQEYGQFAGNVLLHAKQVLPSFQYKIAKHWLTATYGKFAQEPIRRERRDDLVPWVWDGSWEAPGRDGPLTRYEAVDGQVYEVYWDPTYGPRSPQIWASITAYARVVVHTAAEVAGRGHCVYRDADCMIVDDAGLSRLAQAGYLRDELGGWRVKAEGQSIEITAPRVYRVGELTAHAGVHYRLDFPGSPDWHYSPEAFQRYRLSVYLPQDGSSA